MKKTISIFLALLLALTPAFALERWQDRFAGDPYMELVRTASNWAEQHIRRANLAGIIPETMYEDWQADTTRAEFCKMALNYLCYATGKTVDELLADRGREIDPNRFTDTSDPDILAAAALSITAGIGDGLFGPDRGFTREQAATMLRNVCRSLEGYDIENAPQAEFSDMGTVATYATGAVNFVNKYRIMVGSGTEFLPSDAFSRQMSIATFCKLMPKPGVFVREDGFTFDPERDVDGTVPTGVGDPRGAPGLNVVDRDVMLTLIEPAKECSRIYFDEAGQLWMDIDFPELPEGWEWSYRAMFTGRVLNNTGTGMDNRTIRYGSWDIIGTTAEVLTANNGSIHISVEGFTRDIHEGETTIGNTTYSHGVSATLEFQPMAYTGVYPHLELRLPVYQTYEVRDCINGGSEWYVYEETQREDMFEYRFSK